jgi:lipopolysaccharide cholinephosphotransferase
MNQRLSKIHDQLYLMLNEINALCEKHDIEYWIDAGTLLGAVRHGGFIPWDDDIDLCMTRSNYNRFIAIAHSELAKNRYLLQPFSSYFPFAKYCNSNIKVKEHWGAELDLYIDIFPFELYKEKYLLSDIRWKLAKYKEHKRFLKKISSCLGTKLTLRQRILLSLPIERTEDLFGIKPINITQTNGTIGYRVGKEFNYFPRRFISPEKLFPLAKVKFCDAYFPAPANPDYYLTRFYGDYMKIPENKSGHYDAIE